MKTEVEIIPTFMTKVTKIMYSGIAATQLAKMFNTAFETEIKTQTEVVDGTSFVTIDFGDTPINVVFHFSYELGIVQKTLMKAGELFITPALYSLPTDNISLG